MDPYELEPLSFTITDPWRPIVKPPPARRAWTWKIPAVCGGTFVIGMLVVVAIGVREAPSTTIASTARMPAVVAPPPPPPVIEIVEAPAPPKPVRRASPAPKRPRVVVATPGLFDRPD